MKSGRISCVAHSLVQGKKTLILDLDETLVHCTSMLSPRSRDSDSRTSSGDKEEFPGAEWQVLGVPCQDGSMSEMRLYLRPGVRTFLQEATSTS